jgi:hypothetical protein
VETAIGEPALGRHGDMSARRNQHDLDKGEPDDESKQT